MEYRGMRVVRPFKWGGWNYAPKGSCNCDCGTPRNTVSTEPDYRGNVLVGTREVSVQITGPVPHCTKREGTGCECNVTVCSCTCGLPHESFAGDIWVVDIGTEMERQEGRVYALVEISRMARPDVTAHDTAIDSKGVIRADYKKYQSPPVPEGPVTMASSTDIPASVRELANA